MAKEMIETPVAPLPVRVLLIILLPVLAAVIYWDGRQYDSDLLDFREQQDILRKSAGLFPAQVQALAPFGAVRYYSKDTLYEYINGHAEFFLSAGFQSLAVGEYAQAGATAPALVVNLYDMGKGLHAFGVLMDEAGESEAVDVGTMGLAGGQGINFILGPYYAQVTVFDAALSVLETAQTIAAHLAGQVQESDLAFSFPELGEVSATRFIKESYRGLEMLDNVLERSFRRGEQEIAVFLINNADVPLLLTQLTAFLDEDGIAYRRSEYDGLSFYQVDDPYEGEWFFLPLKQSLIGAYAPLDESLRQRLADFAQGH
jgi:hypothetical protein